MNVLRFQPRFGLTFNRWRRSCKFTLNDPIDYSPSTSFDTSLDYASRISRDNAVCRHVVNNNTSGRDNAIVANFDPREDNATRTNLTIFSNPSIQGTSTYLVISKNIRTKLDDSICSNMDSPWMVLT